MDDDMITVVMQDKVAALKDGSAGLALDERGRPGVRDRAGRDRRRGADRDLPVRDGRP